MLNIQMSRKSRLKRKEAWRRYRGVRGLYDLTGIETGDDVIPTMHEYEFEINHDTRVDFFITEEELEKIKE